MKGKKTSVIIALALAVSLLAATSVMTHGAEPSVGDNIIRVQLDSYGSPTSFKLNAAGSFTVQDTGRAISGDFTVAASGTGISLTTGNTTFNLDGDIYIKAASISASNLLQINGGYKYAGDIRILNKGGKLKLINFVDIETYVMGVLPYEMGNTWPAEALKAQAVAARTYAYYIANSKVRSSVEQDIVDTTPNQVYYGYNAAYTNCIAAVNATKNMVMKTPDGQNVYACYSASNGGMTETGKASGAAASDFAYLPLKEDPYDLLFALGTTNYSGKLTIPKTLLASDLKSNTSQPYKMLREKLNAAGVDTNTISGDVTVKMISLTDPKYTNPDRQFTGANFVLGIPGANDAIIAFGPATFSGSDVKYPFLNDVLGLGNKFSMLTLVDNGSNWLLASVRYGHGAGLSQIGAYQMAAQGKTYQDILTFYYNLGSAVNLVTMPWDVSGGTAPGTAGYTVTAASKTGAVNTPGTTLNVRSGPATGYDILTTLKDGTKVTITGQVADWWRIDIGGGKTGFVSGAYINVDEDTTPTTPPETTPPETTPPNSGTTQTPAAPDTQSKTGKVNTPGTTLNVRSGPGTTYSVIGSLNNGAKVTVTVENSLWYKLTYNSKTGYVSAGFITLDSTSSSSGSSSSGSSSSDSSSSSSNSTQTATQTLYVNTPGTSLNVRSGPGTTYSVIGSLQHGTKITATSASSTWYKLTYNGKTGYVSAAYIQTSNPLASSSTGTTSSGSTSTGSTPSAPAASKTVYVNTPGTSLNVRSGPGTTYSVIGSLQHGSKVTVTDENSSWYKLTYNGKTGYISKSFTQSQSVTVSSTPSQTVQKTGVVNSTIGLNVRSGPGTTYKIVGGLANGTKVSILDQSSGWYKISYGASSAWVSASYIK